jgi:hypothetical protein
MYKTNMEKKKNQRKLGVMAHTCKPSYSGGSGKIVPWGQPKIKGQDLIWKTNQEQKDLGCFQVVEYLSIY